MLWFHSSRCQFSPCTRRCRQRAAEVRLCLLIWKGVEISLKTKSKLLRSISGSRFLDNIRFNFVWIWDLTNNRLINLVTKNASSLDSADATKVISSLCLLRKHLEATHYFRICCCINLEFTVLLKKPNGYLITLNKGISCFLYVNFFVILRMNFLLGIQKLVKYFHIKFWSYSSKYSKFLTLI